MFSNDAKCQQDQKENDQLISVLLFFCISVRSLYETIACILVHSYRKGWAVSVVHRRHAITAIRFTTQQNVTNLLLFC